MILAYLALPVVVLSVTILAVMWRRHRSRAWDWDADPSQNVGA